MAWTAPRTWTDGELVTAAIMNPHIRDNQLAEGPHLIVRKPSDESVTSSTVEQADNDLILPLAANEVWHFKFFIVYTGAAAGDLKIRFTFPTSGDLRLSTIFVDVSDALIFNDISTTTSPTTSRNFGAAAAYRGFPLEGVFVNGANAGNLALEWAQVTSNATPTTIKANSTLWAVKLA